MGPKAKAVPAKESVSAAKVAPPAAPPPLAAETPAAAAAAAIPPEKKSKCQIPPKALWAILGIFALICFVLLAGAIYLYISLDEERKHPADEPMKLLRKSMATGLRTPKLSYENPIKLAEEVERLPKYLEEAEKSYNERKEKYKSLFKKGARSGGWQLFGRSLYYISKGQKTWYDAENFCLSRDAHLASILSDEEQNYINSQLKHSTWIGLSDEETEGRWEWTDGSSLTTQYWSSGHPTISVDYGEVEKDCTSMEPSSSGPNWNEANCHELKRWVCKESLEVERP